MMLNLLYGLAFHFIVFLAIELLVVTNLKPFVVAKFIVRINFFTFFLWQKYEFDQLSFRFSKFDFCHFNLLLNSNSYHSYSFQP